MQQWVDQWAAILGPTDVHWCNGSVEERDRLCEVLVDSGTFVRLSESLRPDSF
ncbi:MAG: hypothetical protein ACK4V6_05220, partial [Microthrixaceae bacterium]